MKIIKLFLLLSFVLWAEFKLDILNTVDVSQLENIVKNGWDDSNKTLNNFIVSNVERVMPEILEKIQNPVLKGLVTQKDLFPASNLVLTSSDYLIIISYIKFLEYSGDLHQSKKMYIDLFKGLNNINDKTFLAMAARVVYEDYLVDSLLEGLKKQHYSHALKLELKTQIEDLLLEDKSQYIKAVEYEKKLVLEMGKSAFLIKSKDDNINHKNFMDEVYKSYDKYVNIYFDKMIFAMKNSIEDNSKEAIENFNMYFDGEKEQHFSSWNKVKVYFFSVIPKVKSLLGLTSDMKGFLTEYVGKTNALAAVPNLALTTMDYVSLLKKNRVLLKELES